MKKIIEYKLITHWKINEFNHEIAKYLHDGYVLYGYPLMAACAPEDDIYFKYGQAMVKHEDN